MRGRLGILIACAAAAGCWPGGCEKKPAPPTPTAPVLAQAPAPQLSADERAMVEVMASIHRSLTRALQSAPARTPKLSVVEPAMQAALRPYFDRVAALTPKYYALPKDRRRLVQRTLHREHEAELIEFVRAVGAWTYTFDHNDVEIAREFRPLMRNLLREWAIGDHFWFLEGWSQEAVLEFTEWTLTEDEMREVMTRKLDQGEWEHEAVVYEGEPFSVTASTNCLRCHAEDEDEDEDEREEKGDEP